MTTSPATIALEPTGLEHAPAIQRLAAHPDVAATTLVPHPYPTDGAVRFVEDIVRPGRAAGTQYAFVVKDAEEVVGHITVQNVDRARGEAEVGYWIGRPFWGGGYATAALRLVLGFAFEGLGLRSVYAHVLAHNPGSARVLEKACFRRVDLPPEVVPCGCAERGETWSYRLERTAWVAK